MTREEQIKIASQNYVLDNCSAGSHDEAMRDAFIAGANYALSAMENEASIWKTQNKIKITEDMKPRLVSKRWRLMRLSDGYRVDMTCVHCKHSGVGLHVWNGDLSLGCNKRGFHNYGHFDLKRGIANRCFMENTTMCCEHAELRDELKDGYKLIKEDRL